MAHAVQITKEEMEQVLRADRGWEPHTYPGVKEHVYRWKIDDTPIVLLVYSSIKIDTGLSRPVGGDAIRVCAVDTVSKRGYIGTTRVHRVENWRTNLHDRVLEVLTAARARWGAHAKAKAKKEAAEPAGDPDKYAPLFALFAKASDNLKHPKLRLSVNGEPLQLAISGPKSKYAGSMSLSNGEPFGSYDNVWYGSINPKTGKLFKSQSWKDEIGEILDMLVKDPANVAATYGKKTGHCCMCRKALTDPRSVHVGYGATCASNWGLHYPTMSEVTQA